MIRAGVIGATGYAGSILVTLLLDHPDVELVYLASHSYSGQRYSDVYPALLGHCDLILQEEKIEEASELCDVLFLALPHTLASKKVTQAIIEKTVVIDLGADYRLSDVVTYEAWYNCEHYSKGLLDDAVYGLPELHRSKIIETNLIANPGCYPTSSILTLAPLVGEGLIDPATIIIDSASGVTGAGRAEKTANLFCEVNESFKAYGVTNHRHTVEIEQELSALNNGALLVQFTPHLVPMNRGILSTCYATLKEGVGEEAITNAYQQYYQDEPFVRLMGSLLPETRFVYSTNTIAIGWKLDHRTNRVIAIGAIDNLVKGASGQAVQNMNIRFGLDEQAGLAAWVANPL